MASSLYDKAREGFLDGSIVLTTNNIKAVLVDTSTYTPNLATHANLSDIPTPARVATSGNLSGKSVTNGVFDADDLTFAALGGASVEAIVLYKDTGTASTSRLIHYMDAGTGLPFTPNGGDLNLAWSNAANKIFKI
ncbi:hypothetical protein BS618_07475 [Rhodococcus erythropolis]|uniref:hypothetical protein n=1 Tax=Rhodococcus qingshengii TaxID=334542 RepID=UPI0009359219|nr:hypothetical protein [Rhodococcus qingshengii]MCZ4544914.1 hypothetical protein [Rhodococcus qingshengii]OKA15767.1 hypothetical protein BS618_07475 [Rhodococcus erythropolis]